jgi:hypothetical protein
LSIEIYNKTKKNEKQKTTNKKILRRRMWRNIHLPKKHCPFVN